MRTPAIIYHYTTIPGLIGIVTHRELWASDCQFLNDGTELSYARDIFFTELQKLGIPTLEEEGYVPPGRSLQSFRMFITCFCEDGDLLSQWRGYGADQGYALGFDTETLQALNSSETPQTLSPNEIIPFSEIIPVQYGIANPSEYFAKELAEANTRSAHPGIKEWYTSEQLLPRLACVKHPGFAEEREWRILKQIPFYDLKKPDISVQFRPSSMGPIAFLVTSFPPECLREIIIGPGSHIETRNAAVLDMLHYYDLSHVDVRVSRVPFRK